MDDVNEHDVRVLAVDILAMVNDGGHSPEELATAKSALKEALAALHHEGRPGLSQALMQLAATHRCSMEDIEEAIRALGRAPKPVAAC